MTSRIALICFLVGSSGMANSGSSRASSEKRSLDHFRRERIERPVREVNDTYQSDVTEEDSQELQKSLDQVLNSLLLINSGKGKIQITN